ncbi:hypothetical protein RQP46_001251 [Phenoliferia psychrophenolica]
MLFDFDEAARMKAAAVHAERQRLKLPRNLRDGHLLCYSSLWDVKQASGGFSSTSTKHIRRGDFQLKCGTSPNCLPGPEQYAPKVQGLLDQSPPGTVVIVTTDETEDLKFLASIDLLGWHRIDHLKLGTAARLMEKFGEAYQWADAGDDFVGTEGSQVSYVSGERVIGWHGGTFELVGLVYNS